ncbi:MAG: coenzyme F430 synthase, partial [Methanoregula sp.]|nr:coenzyme F430 synthase [Methanoregula sp.]
ISLGVTGAGDLAIITSPDNYMFAAGKKCAIKEKVASAKHAKCVLVAEHIFTDLENVIHAEEVACCKGIQCTVRMEGMEFVLQNPLFSLPPYRSALMLAAAAAMILHVNPTPLNHFAALPGRMSLSHEKEIIVVDNANSGTNVETTMCAARYARHCAGTTDLTLVIGQAEGDGAVCEGFSFGQIRSAIDRIQPLHVVWVGRYPHPGTEDHKELKGRIDAVSPTLEEGRAAALRIARKGSVVLAVKTWR